MLSNDVQQLNGVEVPSDLLASIQTKALPELTADPHRHLWSWKSYSLAAVALVLIVLGWLFPKGSEAPALPEPKVAATVVDEQKMMEDLTLASTTLNDEPSLVVKLYTNDPDVVIYWFGN